MHFFKKKPESLIPPVSAPVSTVSSTISLGSSFDTYVASRDSAAPSNDYSSDLLAKEYNRNRGAGDVYSRGTAELDKDRDELFSGYNPTKSGSGRFFDGPKLATGKEDEEGDDDDVEGIKQQIRFVKQESVNSTRNALRLAREAEETGRNTLARLGEQSEKLADTERSLDDANGHTQRAGDNAKQIAKLNGSIFRPAIRFDKCAKRAAQDAKRQDECEARMRDREAVAMHSLETQRHLGEGREADSDGFPGGRRDDKPISNQEQRKPENDGSDDVMEDQLAENLSGIRETVRGLHKLSLAMGREIDHQKPWIEGIGGKADRLENGVRTNIDRLNRIK